MHFATFCGEMVPSSCLIRPSPFQNVPKSLPAQRTKIKEGHYILLHPVTLYISGSICIFAVICNINKGTELQNLHVDCHASLFNRKQSSRYNKANHNDSHRTIKVHSVDKIRVKQPVIRLHLSDTFQQGKQNR